MAKKALGKGLGALIRNKKNIAKTITSKKNQNEKSDQDQFLPISEISTSSSQPRKDFSSVELDELKDSIEKYGVLQPVIVRKSGDSYQIIAGERRYRAAYAAGLKEIPVLIKEANDQKSLEIALIENIQRQHLNIIEEANAYQLLMDEYGLTQEGLSIELGKSRSVIANAVRMLQLPSQVLEYLKENKITHGHAKVILGLNNPAQQLSVADEIIKKDLSVRQAEQWVLRITKNFQHPKKKIIDPVMEILQTSLEEQLATKVRILKKSKGGKLEIEYYSDDDLERLISKMNLSLEAIT